jgi:multiple sugar transport system substrate-binding protein
VAAGGSSPSLSVFWALAVTAGARDPASAWEFVRHAARPEMDRLTSLNGCVGTRLSTWRDPEIRATSPAYAAMEEVHQDLRSMPATVRLPLIVQILNEMVDDAINRRSAVPEALSRAAQRIGSLSGPLGCRP